MTVADIEKRLMALEKAVGALKADRGVKHPSEVLERTHGSFQNDKAFREAMRLGRKWRDGQDKTRPRNRAKRG